MRHAIRFALTEDITAFASGEVVNVWLFDEGDHPLGRGALHGLVPVAAPLQACERLIQSVGASMMQELLPGKFRAPAGVVTMAPALRDSEDDPEGEAGVMWECAFADEEIDVRMFVPVHDGALLITQGVHALVKTPTSARALLRRARAMAPSLN